jgi:hypothetical protein
VPAAGWLELPIDPSFQGQAASTPARPAAGGRLAVGGSMMGDMSTSVVALGTGLSIQRWAVHWHTHATPAFMLCQGPCIVLLAFLGSSCLLQPRGRTAAAAVWASPVTATKKQDGQGQQLSPSLATDKFVRSIGAGLIGLSVLMAGAVSDGLSSTNQPRPRTALELTPANWLPLLVLCANSLGQGECAVRCLLDPSSQTRAMRPPFDADRSGDRVIRRFGAVSAAVSAMSCAAFAAQWGAGGVATVRAVAAYHACAFTHNGYSAAQGLFGYGKAASHGALALAAVVAVCAWW